MLAWLTIALSAAAEGAETKSGLPQLNPNDMTPQLVWLAITFLALYFILSRFTLPRISSVIDERKNRIERDIAEAERLNAGTQNAIAEYEEKLQTARGKASQHVKENRDAVAADLEAKRRTAEAEDQDRMKKAEERIAAMKSEAMAQVTAISTETAQEIVKKLVGQDVSAEEVRRVIGGAVVEEQTV
jgi:F-type H+-transporting ATPase subunit b